MTQRFVLLFTFFLLIAASSSLSQNRNFPDSPFPHSWRISLEGGIAGLGCDITSDDGTYRYKPFGDFEISYVFNPNFYLGLYIGSGRLGAKGDIYEVGSTFYFAGVQPEIRWTVIRGAFAPLIFLRLGGMIAQPYYSVNEVRSEGKQIGGFTYGGGIGFEYVYKRIVAIRFVGGSILTTTDKLDNIVSGNLNDGWSFFSIGFSYYFTFTRYRR